jgi:peptidoglycan/LPS O-acetylase OafA/YrhL
LDRHNNSLNLIRLILAALVIFSHTYPVGYGLPDPRFGGQSPGHWAVIGFFVLSGYLVTGSRLTRSLGQYLIHRIARIYPGYLACLLVIVCVAAPIAYWLQHQTLDGYLSAEVTPTRFLWNNLALHIGSFGVAGTPAGVPYPDVWDGSLWTLWYEFLCYLVVGLLFCLPVMKRRAAVLVPAVFGMSVVLCAWNDLAGLGLAPGPAVSPTAAELLAFFLGGATMRAWSKWERLSAPGAALAAVIAILAVALVPIASPEFIAPALCYLLLWLGSVVPSPALIKREDISYGMYIYGFIIQQGLVLAGGSRLPLPAFAALAAALTVVPATASWLVVEKRAMRWARCETISMRFAASPLRRFAASPLRRFAASPLRRFAASPLRGGLRARGADSANGFARRRMRNPRGGAADGADSGGQDLR